tara:strand:+ start:337 stop:495 length:159 start_codon:yes stop_codon:yes gene_type:complete
MKGPSRYALYFINSLKQSLMFRATSVSGLLNADKVEKIKSAGKKTIAADLMR